eukprot:CAMPEP_0197024066 /NCGR_PEP_ID=MMETSP1384-20130603/4712_1 /TAXON_ID=29189 /ORGANISM="Ammonia sp." /LENGTH=564 /DNA_ID=CAMNT_0042452401 /DNA_START=26 /DNA_END=1720 /DNA_ORIENTATION=+
MTHLETGANNSASKKRGVYSNEDPTQIFEVVEQLGKGSYGGVVKARDTRDDSVVAIKIVQIETDNTKELIREIAILSKCRSKYIVNYCGSYRRNDEIWITMEYCGAGSVGDVIKITKRTLREEQIAVIAKHTLSGLKYLHKNNIIHRDIKAGNILLNHQGLCKLADFGVSTQLAQTISRRNTVIGSPYWMAPEVLKQNNYDQKADIWSMAISIMEMAQGKPPLSDLHPLRALLQIPSNPSPQLSKPSKWSQHLHDFLALALQKDPAQRASAAELLKHPFIRNAGKKQIIQQLVLNVMPKVEKYREEKRQRDLEEFQKKQEKEKENEKKGSSKKKKKRKKRKIYNAEPASDDEFYHNPQANQPAVPQVQIQNEPEIQPNHDAHNGNDNGYVYGQNGEPGGGTEEVFDDSTMIIQSVEKEKETKGDDNGYVENGNDHNDENDGRFDTMIPRKKPKIDLESQENKNVDIRSPEYIIQPLFTERSDVYKEFDLEDYLPDEPTKEQLQELRKQIWTAYWKDKQVLEDYYIDCRQQIRELLDKVKQGKKKKKKRHSDKPKAGRSSLHAKK